MLKTLLRHYDPAFSANIDPVIPRYNFSGFAKEAMLLSQTSAMAKFALTRKHVDTIFDAMSQNDANTFFAAVDPDVRWVIGSETKDPVRKTGVYNVASWVAEVATELRSRFVDGAIKMTIVSVDIVGNKAIAELRSEAVQKNGKPYCNRYVWILIFSEDTGKIVEIREYLDTAHVQEVIEGNDVNV
ncbi:hypothetical protein K438DRAFT_1970722 [Mycena galopus ATCC 62051]|nr:hypothetical protein K438DRAFT_1970722 [Mycena galopus ATCC 62051]